MNGFYIDVSKYEANTDIHWNLIRGKQYHIHGYVLQEPADISAHDISALDGNFAVLVQTISSIECYTDIFNTKPIYYSVSAGVIIISSNVKICGEFCKKIPRSSKLTVCRSTLNVNVETYYNYFRRLGSTTIKDIHHHIDDIIGKIKVKKLGLMLSEGHDSGVICASLLKNKKHFTAISIDLMPENIVLEERHQKLHNGLIVRLSLLDRVNNIKKYSRYIPEHAPKTSGYVNASKALEVCDNQNISHCLTGTGGDKLCARNLEMHMDHFFGNAKGIYPYQSIPVSCEIHNEIQNVFNVNLIHPFLFKSMWEYFFALESMRGYYKQVFVEYMTKERFPYRSGDNLDTKAGFEGSDVPIISHIVNSLIAKTTHQA